MNYDLVHKEAARALDQTGQKVNELKEVIGRIEKIEAEVDKLRTKEEQLALLVDDSSLRLGGSANAGFACGSNGNKTDQEGNKEKGEALGGNHLLRYSDLQ